MDVIKYCTLSNQCYYCYMPMDSSDSSVSIKYLFRPRTHPITILLKTGWYRGPTELQNINVLRNNELIEERGTGTEVKQFTTRTFRKRKKITTLLHRILRIPGEEYISNWRWPLRRRYSTAPKSFLFTERCFWNSALDRVRYVPG